MGKSVDYSLIVIVCLVLFLVIIVIMILIFQRISYRYVLKNREQLFKANKKYCTSGKKHGNAILKKYPTYSEYIKNLHINKTIRCSRSVVSNSATDPIKYVLKYSNISNDINDIERLEFIACFLRDYEKFIAEMENIGDIIRQKLPAFHRKFINEELLPYIVCDLDQEKINSIKIPRLRFLYISPAGRSKQEHSIEIGKNTATILIGEISKSINKKGHSRAQRSIMTNDLREAIKKRDNYTCCICGNSVYDEPNLLLEVDHIIPISKGGKTEASNLQTLCWRCNRAKGDKA